MATDVASADAEKKPDSDARPKAVEEKHDGTSAVSTAPAVQRAAGTSLGQRQVQAKSAHGNAKIGDGDDPAERKADMAADHVMRMPDASPAPPPTPGSSPASGSTPAPTPAAAGPSPAPASAPASASASPSPASASTSTPRPSAASPSPASGSAPAGTSATVSRSPAPGSAPAATPDEPVRRTEDPAAEQRLPSAEPAKPAASTSTPAASAGPDTTTPAGLAPLVAPPAAAGSRPAETGTPAPDAEPPAPEGEAPARETPQVPNDVQEYLDASRGKGAPLPDATRKLFEAKFQHPFDDVRIHDGAGADDAAKKIDALAFTRGNDIYLRIGAYDPTSQEGKHILAHELTHVIQQRTGINRKTAPGLGGTIIRRAGDSSSGGPRTSLTLPDDLDDPAKKKDQAKGEGGGKEKVLAGTIDTTKPSLKLKVAYVPKFKADLHKGKKLMWNRAKRTQDYRTTWVDAAGKNIAGLVPEKAKQVNQTGPPFYFQYGDIPVFGTPEDIGKTLSTIPWEKEPSFKAHTYQIDHKHEFQLGGEDNQIGNLWLLDQSANAASGAAISRSVDTDIRAFLSAAAGKLSNPPPLDPKFIKNNYKIEFDEAVGRSNPRTKEPSEIWGKSLKAEDSWEVGDLGKASALAPLKKMKGDKIKEVRGSAGNLTIVTRRAGRSILRSVPYDLASGNITVDDKLSLPRAFKMVAGKYEPGKEAGKEAGEEGKTAKPDEEVGQVTVRFFPSNKHLKEVDVPVPIRRMSGVDYGGFLDTSSLWQELNKRRVSHKQASPVDLLTTEFDFDKGLVASAKIPKPSISLLENVELNVVIEGEDVGIEATIGGGELKLPGPFKVTGGSLTLSATTGGMGIEGQIDFEIQKLAKGFIRGAASSKAGAPGFAVEAELNFDKKMFDDDARVKGSYSDGKWAVEGTLGVGPDKIKGIKKASATVNVADDTVTADGEFETSIKGVDKGKLGFKYNEATGMEITGEIILGKGIPGIKSGKLDATIKEGPTGHSLSGDVTLEPSVPGLTGNVTGKYEDGAFLVEADLGYEKGLAKGSVKVGLTNQAVGAEGKPAGPPKKDGSLTVYGGGTVILTLTPWLQGTVGLKLTRTGEIEVSGEVALPSTFEVFKERALEKQLLSIGIDIPIIGVAVAGQRIGIFATIRGGVSISAGFGPGELRDVALKVTYNPAKPDDTTVSGHGNFVVPAHAGLRLSVDGGLGPASRSSARRPASPCSERLVWRARRPPAS